MKIVRGYPPNISEIWKRFEINPYTCFAYGSRLFVPNFDTIIDGELIAHEVTHELQMKKMGTKRWWHKYLRDDGFRLSQEVEACAWEYKHIMRYSRKGRVAKLNRLARIISGPQYGKVCTPLEAKRLIKKHYAKIK